MAISTTLILYDRILDLLNKHDPIAIALCESHSSHQEQEADNCLRKSMQILSLEESHVGANGEVSEFTESSSQRFASSLEVLGRTRRGVDIEGGKKERQRSEISSDSRHTGARPSTAAAMKKQRSKYCQTIDLYVISNWGDPNTVGLTGISGIDDLMEEITLPTPSVLLSQEPKSRLGISIGEVELVNGTNLTVGTEKHISSTSLLQISDRNVLSLCLCM